jgi:magnesium chelatase subunit D
MNALEPTGVEGRRARWDDAVTAARLFAIDPSGLRGAVVAAAPGAVRDLWLDTLRDGLADGAAVRRLPAGIGDDRLLGGVDLVATLGAGRPVLQKGLLAEADGGIIVVPMAERLSADMAARLAATLDWHEIAIEREGIGCRTPSRIGLVAFDEGVSADECVPPALLERCAFHIDLRDLGLRGLDVPATDRALLAAARTRLHAVESADDDIVEALVSTAADCGIGSILAPLLALRTARAAAALGGRRRITPDDAALAARLVLGPRARIAPPAEAGQDAGADERDRPPTGSGPRERSEVEEDEVPAMPSVEDILRAAVQAALPPDLLQRLDTSARMGAAPARRQGAGSAQAAAKRGRSAGVRPGPLLPGARLALVDTLRAAAPWQKLRGREAGGRARSGQIAVRRADFRFKKFVRRRESTIIFCVDASGSAAIHRLAEAKGAVQLLLGEAYAERTHAALVVFRGTGADLLLPPTRSLSRAKSLLATLPGGGGTPLAAGIDTAVVAALSERGRGREPLIVVLSDGRANVGRDGLAARPAATDEAQAAARQLFAQRIASVFIDTSPRPREDAADLAAAMGARYAALPYVEASAVRDMVMSAVSAPRSRSPGLP